MEESILNGNSLDILEENINKLKELFPEIITEDKIDFDKFKQVFHGEIDDSSERYSFNWNGKFKTIQESQKPSTGTLIPVKEESKDWDRTQNLYIEGDNLEVLKLLQKSYYGKIKMIYIDPPYNTGNDFIYSDNYKDNLENYLELTGQVAPISELEERERERERESIVKLTTNSESSGRFHTNWLNMIYPRLKLARNLLKDDGVIFISIDDNEECNLKKICDELFGEDNFITSFAWLNSVSDKLSENTLFAGANLGKIKKAYEYVLLYSKNPRVNLIPENPRDDFIIKLITNGGNNINEIIIPQGIKCIKPITKIITGRVGGKKDYYDILTSSGMIFEEGVLKNDVKIKGPLRNPNVLRRFFNKEEVIDRKGQKLVDVFFNENGMLQTKKERVGDTPSNIIIGKGSAKHGTLLLKNMFGFKIFDFSKPIELIEYLLERITLDNEIVLDFFSGSSSTGHAVMNLNSKNPINRKFMMIQMPELVNEKSEAYKEGYKNICEIGKERLRRAGDKIKSESNNKDLDIGFKVFKLDSSNLNKWNPDYNNVEQTVLDSEDNLVSGRTELDLVYEIMLKYGIDLTLPIEEYEINNKKVYSIGFGALLICLDNNITKEIAIPLIELKNKLAPETSRVVFKDNGFASDSDKTNIKETLKTNDINEFITI